MTDRYELWHGQNTRSLRVVWLAEELDIADRLDIHAVPFPARIRAPDYLQTNPLGSLPFFAHGATRISESIAICQYILAKHGPTPLAVEPEEASYGDYLQFSLFGEASMMPTVGAMVRYHLLDGPEKRSETAIADARQAFLLRQERVSAVLAREGEFLAGGRMTLADISVGYTLRLVDLLGEGQLLTPDIGAYLARLRGRPALERAAAL